MKSNWLVALPKLFLISLIFLLLTVYTSAQTKETVKPYLHKPTVGENPKLEQFGTFKTALFPGAATYTYDIELPEGTNDLTPALSLEYSSQSAFESPNLVGAGWSMTSNYIAHDVNGSVDNTSNDFLILSLDGYTDKIYNYSGIFKTHIERYLRIENKSSGNTQYWIITDKDGTQYRFGTKSNSRITSNASNYLLKWYL